ncbi:hypothetical protein E2C01_042540 [Portunus trituberculatus]|uniref:Uncharacterized protein n=1 Tax=Portunus trituberculatus TaxID=210409 RepID=A0A5B7FTR1_PORTR|nr:hypothetical protein [Portunus trituberculatus]
MARRCWSTCWMSQVSAYVGDNTLKLKTPLKNLLTRGRFPTLQPSTIIPSNERASLAVLIEV